MLAALIAVEDTHRRAGPANAWAVLNAATSFHICAVAPVMLARGFDNREGTEMFRRSGLGVLCGATCALGMVMALPAVAAAHTKVVFAGGPAGFQNQIQHKYGAGVNNFLNNRVTIHAGDSVKWDGKSLSGGFHTVDIPALGKSDLPLIVPTGTKVSGVNDAAGNPFWFNGLPNLTFNPALFQSQGGHRYNGSTRIDSGLPLGPAHSFKVQFTKPGVYHYFCDVHYGMRGTIVVLPKAKHIPSAKQDAKTLKKAEAAYVASRQEGRQDHRARQHRRSRGLRARRA